MSWKVLIPHTAVSADDGAEDQDVLVQAAAVAAACEELGHTAHPWPCGDLADLSEAIDKIGPDVVFNLLESLHGSDRFASLVPPLLEHIGLPFTGSARAALDLTNDKIATKLVLQATGLPTPRWIGPDDYPSRRDFRPPSAFAPPAQLIVKPVSEHSSVGMDDACILTHASLNEVLTRLDEQRASTGHRCFAEEFIAGREFNLSLLADEAGPQVLPPAEIDFSAFPAEKPRIVNFAAKWDEASFEFHHTPRRFDFTESDFDLLERLAHLAKRCWQTFGLRGYVRVDFRVDRQGRPWILEINTNPCLSPDAGFAAALRQAGIPFPAAIQRILDEARRYAPSV